VHRWKMLVRGRGYLKGKTYGASSEAVSLPDRREKAKKIGDRDRAKKEKRIERLEERGEQNFEEEANQGKKLVSRTSLKGSNVQKEESSIVKSLLKGVRDQSVPGRGP